MTVTGPNGEVALGYLIDFTGHGIYSPDGKIEVTKQEMDAHNAALAMAELKGLDENCQVGQRGTFYYSGGKVSTFTGAIVSENVFVQGKSITFTRNGKQFKGILQKDADCFNFKRVK